jgi:transcriptional regulator with XRE-family HTH domain
MKSEPTWLDQHLSDPSRSRTVEQERLILAITEGVFEHLEKQGLTRADLAEKLGKSRAFVTQMLSGSRNMTLRSVADFYWALGLRVNPTLEPIGKPYQQSAEVQTTISHRFVVVSSSSEPSREPVPDMELAA